MLSDPSRSHSPRGDIYYKKEKGKTAILGAVTGERHLSVREKKGERHLNKTPLEKKHGFNGIYSPQNSVEAHKNNLNNDS